MTKLHLVLLIHAHQPLGNFDEVVEHVYQQSYLPFLELAARHPAVRIGLHFSGALLEWIEAHHPEFLNSLAALVARGQVEMMGGGFYEPILIAIPPEDQAEQVRRMAEYLEKRFGQRPAGAWLTERVWEPQLPSILARCGVKFTLVDDMHFLAAGMEPHQLHGYFICEDAGQTVKVIPGLKELRYLIPFRSVEETIGFLRGLAERHPGAMAAMGDDCEKFGGWPGTHKHCYLDGWLERFFAALEASSDWLTTTLPGEYVDAYPPLGRADLPTASYTEMMEWALPTSARQRFHGLQQEFASRADVLQYLRGGFWRGFFSKYPESNLLHKKMLYVSRKVRELDRGAARSQTSRRNRELAHTHLLRGQCNDAYWHGIFGGLYAPHLRAAAWSELVQAEARADAAAHRGRKFRRIERLDFDADGTEDICLTSPQFAALLKPSDGATLAALDFRPRGLALINSFQRRPEAYHARLREGVGNSPQAVASIHEQTRFKEAGLEDYLRYDRWARHAFRLLLFAPGKTVADYEAVRLDESASFAAGPYKVMSAAEGAAEFACEALLCGSTALPATKKFVFASSRTGFSIACNVDLENRSAEPLVLQVGVEMVLNRQAPRAKDRYFEAAGVRHPLGWSGALIASELRLVDEWAKVTQTLSAPGGAQFWIAPIETVSESEEGFERIYQGSAILAVWPAEIAAGKTWKARLELRVSETR